MYQYNDSFLDALVFLHNLIHTQQSGIASSELLKFLPAKKNVKNIEGEDFLMWETNRKTNMKQLSLSH